MIILITGGTGHLGRALVADLQPTGHTLRIASRKPAPLGTPHQWAQLNLAKNEGLAAAVQDVDVIVHAASNAMQSNKTDVIGTQALLVAAKKAGVKHLVYTSIIGIERMQKYAYYRHKLAAEQAIEASGLPFTIVRAAQFHWLADTLLKLLNPLGRLPVAFAPKAWQMQPIDVRDVADYLQPYILDKPAGCAPDVAGPDVLTMDDMAHQWLAAQNRKKPVLPVRLPIGLEAGFRAGHNTSPDKAFGTRTWSAWLKETYQQQ